MRFNFWLRAKPVKARDCEHEIVIVVVGVELAGISEPSGEGE
jgi:hypothetical protein